MSGDDDAPDEGEYLSEPMRFGARACPGLPIFVTGGDPTERGIVCRGAADALAFFAENGLDPPARIDVAIGAELPEPVRDTAAGCYDATTRRKILVTYQRMRRFGTWFDQPVGRATNHALATHETSHAIAACLFGVADPTHVAHEFIAYAATFEKMEPALRTRILTDYPDDGAGERRLSERMHAMNPTRFAVDAWLLWRRPENGAAYLREVHAGHRLRGGGAY
jgi:hypothetical protein